MWHKPCRTFHPWCPRIKTRCLFLYLSRTYQWNFSNEMQVPYIHKISVSDKKQALSKMSFYQQNTISLYSWFLLVLSCNIFLMTFHGSIFLNIKLEPATTSSPRRRGRGLFLIGWGQKIHQHHDRIANYMSEFTATSQSTYKPSIRDNYLGSHPHKH